MRLGGFEAQMFGCAVPSWAKLGPSWGQVGAKLGQVGAKLGQVGDPKGDHFFVYFLDRFWTQLGANLASTWEPKPSQNGAKLEPKSIQIGVWFWKLFLDGWWVHFLQFCNTC